MSSAIPPVFNFDQWIRDNEDQLKPPVSNKAMYVDDDLIVMVVGGPNQRHDFHYEPYPELFYQYRGNMHVNIQTDDGLQRIDIREGDLWLLPPNTYHSPQRPEADSIGLVVEKVREPGKLEKFAWFCQNCNYRVHEVELKVDDIVKDLPPVFEAFHNSDDARTCSNCGDIHPGKG